jgi:DNA-binding Lrp family transcriptional regulator
MFNTQQSRARAPQKGESIIMKQIKAIEAKILRDLLRDGRKDFGDIAKECGVPRKTIWNHYNKLRKTGVIVGATTQYNYKLYGYSEFAEVVAISEAENIEEKVENIRRTENLYGLFRFIPKNKWLGGFRLRSLNELEQLKEEIRRALSASVIKTYIWTDVKNIPENLSFGLSNGTTLTDEPNALAIKENNCVRQEIDEIDRQITEKLAKNGRESFTKIAEEIGVSTDTVTRRYERLKRTGALKTVIQFSPSKVGYQAVLDARIAYSSRTNSHEMVQSLVSIPDLVCLCRLSGDFDIHIWALIRDFKHFFSIQESIVGNPGVTKFDAVLTDMFAEKYPTPWQFTSTF